ncbi:ATP-dependent Clp protease ATP-binding subunit [Candidatus Daviesbacteria bacterium]|nr:ATP-dependent Clp protease ATP-binding subunit [Candidatus Daviesbacteria bacterium]
MSLLNFFAKQPNTPNGSALTQTLPPTSDPLIRQQISVLSNLDSDSVTVLEQAKTEARNFHQALIEPAHILLGLLSDQKIIEALNQFSLDISQLIREIRQLQKSGNFSGEPTLSEESKQTLEDAFASVQKRGENYIRPLDILMSIFAKSSHTAKMLESKGAKIDQIKQAIVSQNPSQVLEKFGIDLTKEALEGKLDPVAGRDAEIDRIVHILLRRTKNNPLIIGEAGVGKTAVVEGLARLIVSGQTPPQLKDKIIIKLDVSSLIAGASHRGEFEARLQDVIKKVLSSNQIILFIDEIHTVIGAGDAEGSIDASNILKPYLTRGTLRLIGTTTPAEFKRYFEKDRAFSRRFQPVSLEEPTEQQALQMIAVLKPKYEQFHSVTFSEGSIKAAVHLSKRYIGERFLPDKAIDLLDEAAANVKIAQNSDKRTDTTIQSTDIEQIISSWTGIPVTRLTEKESEKLLNLEALIHKSIISQNEAVSKVAEAVRRGRIGLSDPNRPVASFVFLGPTGVGKTELAKTLANILFGSKESLIRLDMSEFMEKHEVAKLLGAPPGYVGYEEGGQLTEAVRRKPYSIVLLDEIEKAHPDVFNILLQILEDGRLTDNKGNTISFKNTIIITTSNIASQIIQDYLHQQNVPNLPPLKKVIMAELSKFFKPELLNRFDEIVIFEPLTPQDMVQITKLGIESTQIKLKERNISLQVSDSALQQISKEGFDPLFGARGLRRLIQAEIENPISIFLINHNLVEGDTAIVDYNMETGHFTFSKPQKPQTNG